jgi:large subunit ribosomal protein L13
MVANKIVFDGENALLGRLAATAAKQALQGNQIIIVNSEKIIISGNKKNILENYRKRKEWIGNTQKGPRYFKQPKKIIKHAIRGMLPNYRWGRGREAFKRVRCYENVPEEYQNAEKIKIMRELPAKFIDLATLSKHL